MSLKEIIVSKLVLGTAQFGFKYGVANQGVIISIDEGRKIFSYANSANINTLDTAIAYGQSQYSLGQIGVVEWNVISKLSKLPIEVKDIDGWVESQIVDALKILGINHFYGILLHQSSHNSEEENLKLFNALQKLKESGLIGKLGISIYNPSELDSLFDKINLDLVQTPFNILDRRLIESDWVARMKNFGIEIHVRSVFLQGLLLMPASLRPAKFEQWKALWELWDSWLLNEGISAMEACIAYVFSQSEIDKVVIGVDNAHQLQQIIDFQDQKLKVIPDFAKFVDETLINPSLWGQL